MDSTGNVKSAKSYLSPLLAGAVAGLSVDVTLYPLDTLKTRLQSEQGFYKAGGFKGVYRGLLTVATTSMPTTALFFASYEATKNVFEPMVKPQHVSFVHMFAASIGETIACLIRVPTEIAKQRKQTYTGPHKRSSIRILVHAFKTEGVRQGVYRGFFSTVLRDLPFSFIELPLWELFKTTIRDRNDGNITSFQSALCGSAAGGLAAAATTPLDLAKTRIMLAGGGGGGAGAGAGAAAGPRRVVPVLAAVYGRAGVRGLFAGVAPRTAAFTAGGFVFFGFYEHSRTFFDKHFNR